MKLAFVMLAAGNSRRFGTNKLLYEIDGIPMYLRMLEKLKKIVKQIPESELVVVTQYEEIVAKAIEMNVPVFMNPYPERGISLSLQIGLKCVRDTDACFFTVSDQPWLTEQTIVKLIKIFMAEKKGMACTLTKDGTGNPCIFARKYYRELMELSGDKGGKQLIKKYPEDVAYLRIEDARELQDIDRPEILL